MNWNSIYQPSFEKESKGMDTERDQPVENNIVSCSDINGNENEELYQKKLFENDLYVWSLLLLIADKK
jgi:hypothetical protein